MKKTHTFSQRLQELIEIKGITKSELARSCGIDKSNVTRYINGEYEAKQAVIYRVAEKYGVSVAWLNGYDVPFQSGDGIGAEDEAFISSLGRMMERRELPPEVDAVNALIYSKGWRIEKYEDGSYGLMLERGDVLDPAHMDALVDHLKFMTQAVVYLYLNDDSDMILPKLRGDAEWMLNDCRRRKVGFSGKTKNERDP